MNEFLTRLTSRKFLLALGSVITLISAGQFIEAAGVAGAYFVAQGLVDFAAVRRVKTAITTTVDEVQAQAEAVDEAIKEQGA